MRRDEILQFQHEINAVQRDVWLEHIAKPEDPIPRLCHYTDAAGLLGILKSNVLWATRTDALNDYSETRYGEGMVTEFLKGQQSAFFHGVSELLVATVWAMRPYVVSFSKTPDDLSQWREYGDRGSGFSIEFDYPRLSEPSMEAGVLDVAYDLDLQRRIISDTCKKFADILGRRAQWGDQKFALPDFPALEDSCETHCRCHLISLLLTQCAAFKDPAFSNENEARLVRLGTGAPPPMFRVGRFGITPYVEIVCPSERLPIKKIWQGPTADRSFAEGRLKVLLKEFGYGNVDFEVSKIPMR